jgi:hypothetical protein
MSITDIFIKTYHKDFIWLEYCLKSIKKYARGFRDIVIVSDNTGHIIPSNITNNILPVKVYYVNLPSKAPTYVEHGLGYLWQQFVKLSWYKYSDAEQVLVLDSDEMLTKSISPESFKTNEKFNWFYRDWEKAGSGICWRESTEFLLNKQSKYDAMALTGFVLQKETSIALKNHLCSLHNCDELWDIIIKYNLKTCSEFNLFGNFVHLYGRTEYNLVINEDTTKYINSTINKEWSWGGISNEIINKSNDILNRENKFALVSYKDTGKILLNCLFNELGLEVCDCSTNNCSIKIHSYNEEIMKNIERLNNFDGIILLYRSDIIQQLGLVESNSLEELKENKLKYLEYKNSIKTSILPSNFIIINYDILFDNLKPELELLSSFLNHKMNDDQINNFNKSFDELKLSTNDFLHIYNYLYNT